MKATPEAAPMREDVTLLPCPFCKSPDHLVVLAEYGCSAQDYDSFTVVCRSENPYCFARGPRVIIDGHDQNVFRAKAIEAWNNCLAHTARPDADDKAEIERLRGLLTDPGSPPWEDARAVLVAELRKLGMFRTAADVEDATRVDIPSHVALNLIAQAARTAPPAPQGGYTTAFYEIADLLGIPARAASPSDVWRDEMRPKLEALVAGTSVAERMFDGMHATSQFEDALADLIEDFDSIGHDYYDCSLEIHGAPDDVRLGIEAQKLIADAGFAKVYVNHKDGWETHYGLGGDLPARGWRRRYVEDAAASTTNVIAGEPNPGYFEISYWPDGWDSPGSADWLENGYMRIVPDPLDPQAPDADLTRKGDPA